MLRDMVRRGGDRGFSHTLLAKLYNRPRKGKGETEPGRERSLRSFRSQLPRGERFESDPRCGETASYDAKAQVRWSPARSFDCGGDHLPWAWELRHLSVLTENGRPAGRRQGARIHVLTGERWTRPGARLAVGILWPWGPGKLRKGSSRSLIASRQRGRDSRWCADFLDGLWFPRLNQRTDIATESAPQAVARRQTRSRSSPRWG